ncbi:T9SS type A sorting domain-containing protein, partial [candidate division FCPU426 bacterium]|nr:T9SS type A sorting domain-containing protein [candidate division FCPU426 bacterium]
AVSDQTGGMIACWVDSRSGQDDIYSQRVDATGSMLWLADGAPVCTAADTQSDPKAASAPGNGAFITWSDNRNSSTTDEDIYLQRLNGSTGAPEWTTDGLPVCQATNVQQFPVIVPSGTAIMIFWKDKRHEGYSGGDVYGQYLDEDGNPLWALDGIPICRETGTQGAPLAVPDGSGGALLLWSDDRNGANDYFAQRVDSSGNTLFAGNGVLVFTLTDVSGRVSMASDDAGGAYVFWSDDRGTGTGSDVYVQRLDGTGFLLFSPSSGMAVCNENYQQSFPSCIPDHAGGACLAWMDGQRGGGSSIHYDIYMQRVDAGGTPLWGSGGTAVYLYRFPYQQLLLKSGDDGHGNVLCSWSDSYNVFAQKMTRPVPRLSSLNPAQSIPRVISGFEISGQFFTDDRGSVTAVKLTRSAQPDIWATNVNVASAQQLTGDADVSTAAVGNWFVVAYDSTGQTAAAQGVFLALGEPTPTCTPSPTVSPTSSITPTCSPTRTITLTCTISPTSTVSPTVTPTPVIHWRGRELIAFPNPARDCLHIIWKDPTAYAASIWVYNTAGECVGRIKSEPESRMVVCNVSDWAPGIYFLLARLQTPQGERKLACQKIAICK